MAFLHSKFINRPLGAVLRPFGGLIPLKYCFAINGTVKIPLTEGKTLVFDGNPTSNLIRVLFWKGIKGFEYGSYKLFVELIKESNSFFDIGANIGYYSIIAKIFNPKAVVVGFEPLPAVHKYFTINAKLNNASSIKIEQLAINDKKGVAQFYSQNNTRMNDYDDHLVGGGSLSKDITKTYGEYPVDVTEVETNTLDNYVADKFNAGIKIDLMKIDTEATEHIVLSGATKVLTEHRPIIFCEIIKGEIENEIQVIMKKFDYLFFRITERGIEEYTTLGAINSKEDFLFVPGEKRPKVERFILK